MGGSRTSRKFADCWLCLRIGKLEEGMLFSGFLKLYASTGPCNETESGFAVWVSLPLFPHYTDTFECVLVHNLVTFRTAPCIFCWSVHVCTYCFRNCAFSITFPWPDFFPGNHDVSFRLPQLIPPDHPLQHLSLSLCEYLLFPFRSYFFARLWFVIHFCLSLTVSAYLFLALLISLASFLFPEKFRSVFQNIFIDVSLRLIISLLYLFLSASLTGFRLILKWPSFPLQLYWTSAVIVSDTSFGYVSCAWFSLNILLPSYLFFIHFWKICETYKINMCWQFKIPLWNWSSVQILMKLQQHCCWDLFPNPAAAPVLGMWYSSK